MTEMDIFKYFLSQGPFAVMFVWLLVYVMRANKDREGRLQDLLDKFSDKYDVIISEIRDIKERFPHGKE
ncbi:BhlA/UviB family holin-like peptide [Paenibacillus terrigena]|uniref:BhlA/UviB family holin-like peptide n=1 Tax=Paenibacillus terrigena TaxID=369333 RepID=UPI00035DC7DD|nr:BhlA/UviB family holin-like peptide [Paenibacillus terrigena]